MSLSAKLRLVVLACVLAALAALIIWSLLGTSQSNPNRNDGPAEPGEFPFMVSVERFKDWNSSRRCAGSIIDQRHILTAAYCVMDELHVSDPSTIKVKLGCNKLSECNESVELDSIKVHPDYHGGNNDVAILVLKRKIKFGSPARKLQVGQIGKISLAGKQQNDENWGNLTVIGWGASETGDVSDVLQKFQVAAMPFAECKKTYTLIGDDEMCAGKRDVYSCKGAPGGPLFKTLADGTHLQVGIISTNKKCDVVGLYTRVASFYSWIMTCTHGFKCESI